MIIIYLSIEQINTKAVFFGFVMYSTWFSLKSKFFCMCLIHTCILESDPQGYQRPTEASDGCATSLPSAQNRPRTSVGKGSWNNFLCTAETMRFISLMF